MPLVAICKRAFAIASIGAALLLAAPALAQNNAPVTQPYPQVPPVVPPAKPGVFTAAKKGANGYHLVVTGKNFTSREAIEHYLAYRAAILTQEQKSSWFTLTETRAKGGRLFILGVGGSAGHAGHAVNDFRKICGFEAYAPTDNVSELTARTNDEGWHTIFSEWLKISKLDTKDALFIFSVGGGNLEKNISPNLVEALKYGKEIGRASCRERV